MMVDGDRAYRERTHDSEVAVAATLRARASAPPTLDHEPPETGSDGLTPEQWSAVRAAFASRVSVLTGGPGVGKTVCTAAIVAEATRANASVALCAPTGRAARRLEDATGHEASTIHRMLEWMPGREPAFGPARPLPVDLVVVDESSMLNLRMMEVLLAGLAESTHIVFVGDADQLPPIGAGRPFDDLIESGIAPVVRLNQIFRQAARSMITTAAHEINQGRAPRLEPREGQERDFFFIDRPDPQRALDTVVEVVAERAPGRYGIDPIRDVQVLAPMYRGPVGLDALNERLQARAQPRRRSGAQRPLPDRRPPDPDPKLARPRADERLDRLPPRRRPRGRGDRRRHRGRPAEDPVRGDGAPCASPTRSRSTRRRGARCR